MHTCSFSFSLLPALAQLHHYAINVNRLAQLGAVLPYFMLHSEPPQPLVSFHSVNTPVTAEALHTPKDGASCMVPCHALHPTGHFEREHKKRNIPARTTSSGCKNEHSTESRAAVKRNCREYLLPSRTILPRCHSARPQREGPEIYSTLKLLSTFKSSSAGASSFAEPRRMTLQHMAPTPSRQQRD